MTDPVPVCLVYKMATEVWIFFFDVVVNFITEITNNEDEFIDPTPSLPKISLPSPLIALLHSTWSDLIKNTEYKYQVKR